MTFATMPPEIISARMYSGPGSGPMLAAASAWSRLATEMNSTATFYGAMITRLASEEWMGPASAAMVAAAKPYLGWLTATGTQAEQATVQARMAAAAFEQAHAMTVPPQVISANRALLQQLITTNILGHNTPAIAATEAQYGQMWEQDALAMHTYAAQSTAASDLQPFSAPPQTTNLAGEAGQTTAVAHANGDAAGTNTLNSLATSGGMDPSSAAAAAADTGGDAGADVSGAFDDPALAFGQESVAQGIGVSSIGANSVNAVWRGLAGVVGAAKLASDGAAKGAAGAAGAATGAATGAASAAGGAAGAASGLGTLGGAAGGLGNAGMIGGLSVPPAWASAPAAAGTAFGPVSGGSWQAVGGSGLMGAMPEAAPHGLPGVPGAPAAGAAAGMAGRGSGFGMPPRYGSKVPVMPRMPGVG
jgi:PPE-repeat protein